jgi:fructose-bisphosphate aldolase, class II
MLSLKQAVDQVNAKYPHSALGAFNFNDMTDLQGIMRAAMHTHQPCIMMAGPAALSYMGIHFVREMHRAANMTSSVPLFLMLDHSDSVDTCVECIDNGFSLVMFDGSGLAFDENVRRTREVVRFAHARGVLVEAEIGRMPGREAHLDVSEMDALLTDPQEAKAFWDQAGVDLLAISFGTAHGVYRSPPRLNFDVIRSIRQLTDAPLVMHGGTGVPDEDLRMAIGCGVKKVNIGTQLMQAYTTAMREGLARMDKEIDPQKILGLARDAVRGAVEDRLAALCTPRVEEMV